MNLYRLNALLEEVKEDKELFNFYSAKKVELLKEINAKVKEELKAAIEFNNSADWRQPTDRELKAGLLNTHLNRLEQMKAEERNN
mgnify:CR=1 FL=1|tara:strand:- start:636 stop:890 length:255 start_codon:yes stop_codon:yes gene_type:complete